MTETQFEQPDLRTTNDKSMGGSTYQHPHTGEVVPSVTSISGLIDKSGFLVPWSAKLAAQYAAEDAKALLSLKDPVAIQAAIQAGGEKLRSAGRDHGSSVHNAIEALSLGKLRYDEVPEDVRHEVDGWLEFVKNFVQSFLLIEGTVWSHRFGYAGTFDAVFIHKDGRHILLDYKTGKDVYADAALQLAALRNADVLVTTDGEFAMPRIDGCAVLHMPPPVLTKTGKVSVRGKWAYREVTADAEDFEVFLALQKAHRWEHVKSKGVFGGKQTKPAKVA